MIRTYNASYRFYVNYFFLFLVVFVSISARAGDYYCTTSDELKAAMNKATTGDQIILAPGEYYNNTTMGPTGSGAYFYSEESGTAASPIIIRSEDPSNPAVIRGSRRDWLTVLKIRGDYWIIKDLKFTFAKNGISLEGSDQTKIINCEVYNVTKGMLIDNSQKAKVIDSRLYNIGEEGVHLRDGSSDAELDGLVIYDTGVENPRIGEAIYVGSDRKLWKDPSNKTYDEKVNNTKIRNCKLGPNVAAEGIDIKEGTTGTIVEHSFIDATGISGENSADSFIDVKGAKVVIRYNRFEGNNAPKLSEGVAVYHRGDDAEPTAFEVVVHNNIFDFDSNTSNYMVFKNGKASAIYAFNNSRLPNSGNNVSTNKILQERPSFYTDNEPNFKLNTTANNGSVHLAQGTYTGNTLVELYATPAKGYRFKNWTGAVNNTTNPLSVTMNSDKNVTAVFEKDTSGSYTLTVQSNNGSVTPSSGTYRENAIVELLAKPNKGYEFSNWSGAITGSENPYSLTMNTNKNIEAVFTKIDAKQITVCTTEDNGNDGNVPENAIDGDINTRWSALGKGKYIQFDLCKREELNFVRIAWFKGDVRFSTFDLQISDNGSDWKTVFSGSGSGTGTQLEKFNLSNVSGRYLRYVGQGNSVNDWNSIFEFEIFAKNGGGSTTVPVSSVSITPGSLTIDPSQTASLTATISPSNASNKSVSWSSSNTAVATVSNSGLVTAISEGSATITVRTNDGNRTATATVSVNKIDTTIPVSSVSLTPGSVTLDPSETAFLTATVSPSNAGNKSVSWSSSNTAVATVSNSGLVTAINKGVATISVTTEDGGKQATASITVNDAIVVTPSGELTVLYSCGDTNPSNNKIKPQIKIENSGKTAVLYSDLTIKYWYTAEREVSALFHTDYAKVGKSNILGSFGTQNGHNYAEISFTDATGSLAAGSDSGTIKLRITNADYSKHDESNDYSFNPAITSYTPYTNITLYVNGNLIWGVEPGSKSSGLTETSSIQDIKLFPNPLPDKNHSLTIQLNTQNGFTFYMYNLSGSLLKKELIPIGTNTYRMDNLLHLDSGVYLIKIVDNNSVSTVKRLVVQ